MRSRDWHSALPKDRGGAARQVVMCGVVEAVARASTQPRVTVGLLPTQQGTNTAVTVIASVTHRRVLEQHRASAAVWAAL